MLHWLTLLWIMLLQIFITTQTSRFLSVIDCFDLFRLFETSLFQWYCKTQDILLNTARNRLSFVSWLMREMTFDYILVISMLSYTQILKTNCKTLGDRPFAHAAPQLWNSLPLNVRIEFPASECEEL